jgi:hypothetical protein
MIEDKRVPLGFLVLFQEQASGGVRDEYQIFSASSWFLALNSLYKRIVIVPSIPACAPAANGSTYSVTLAGRPPR